MRVLFIESGNLWPHTLPKGFHSNGHDIMISGPITKGNLPKMLAEFQPDLVVTIGWGQEHTPEKQILVREQIKPRNIPLIYWAVEDPAYTNNWSLPLIEKMQPDFVFTICEKTANKYQQRGIPSAFLDFGFEESVHFPTCKYTEYSSQIAVVANAYPDKLMQYPDHFRHESINRLIKPLLEKQVRIDFWGNHWDQMGSYLGIEIPKDWIHGHLYYREANKVYSSSDIMIGLQNYPDLVTQRTHEILGSGGFLLTLDSPGVSSTFKPGIDLIVSSSPEDTIEKVNYYLKHADERSAIQNQGHISVQPNSYKARTRQMIDILVEQKIVDLEVAASRENPKFNYFQDKDDQQYLIYKVKTGDSLWRISQTFGVTVDELKELNLLTNGLINENQFLKIKKEETTD
ncbi:glycosyltransferase [Bacillus sp. FJAT-29790]|uniref:glycosyltransferase family protein n=1 Tax=Bacillus sp. FJAT-29790 TaxID=1895002 RepID=UPI001C23E1EA|nr:glycosyltransferase [Bacillus sp. FJAT-29790]MBU8880342.1 glycosyltransferase [Bacillus sp. FJAT-29790]